MILHREYMQGSAEWMLAHTGIPTASQFHNLVTGIKFDVREGDMPKSYLCSKLAEAWIGGPMPGFSTWDTEQGNFRETEAIPWFEFDRGITVDKVGFITTDDGQIGCSPDGLIGEDSGIEVKCPSPAVHIRYLTEKRLPPIYSAQVHGSMLVTGRPRWTFLSYHRKMPALVLEIERDEEIQEKLQEALDLFLSKFKMTMEYLIDLNGGVPPSRPTQTKEPVKFSWEENDVVPP